MVHHLMIKRNIVSDGNVYSQKSYLISESVSIFGEYHKLEHYTLEFHHLLSDLAFHAHNSFQKRMDQQAWHDWEGQQWPSDMPRQGFRRLPVLLPPRQKTYDFPVLQHLP